MYLFDNLPLEIIRYEIIPFLNYHERTAVNLCLPPQDRMSFPLTLPDIIVKGKKKVISNVKNAYWSTVERPHIVEHPRAPRGDELREITFSDMIIQEQIMGIQLRYGQRKIHQAIKDGIFKREPGKPMKCRCCAANDRSVGI